MQGAGAEDNDLVRVFNDLGEVHCTVDVNRFVPHREFTQRTVAAQHAERRDGDCARARHVTDLGGGACFNDARVSYFAAPRLKTGPKGPPYKRPKAGLFRLGISS
jgi:hypothetical protein